METSVRETHWHTLPAYVLENQTLRTVTVPELGAKIAALTDKRSQMEWLVGPGSRPVRRLNYGTWWHEQDMAGWDEMFPTIVACDYPGPGAQHGQSLPDHGEVWSLPWQVDALGEGRLTLSVSGRALPYRLERTADYVTANTLRLRYRVTNLGNMPMPYLWAAHPQFTCGLDGQIILPPEVTQVCNTIPETWGWGSPETCFAWPEATTLDGGRVRLDRVGPPTLGKGRKFFVLPDVHIGWAALLRASTGNWLRMEWDARQLPYFGLWIDEGALNHESVVAPEPSTGFYDSLAVAWQKQRVAVVAPGASHEWQLWVHFGVDGNPLP